MRDQEDKQIAAAVPDDGAEPDDMKKECEELEKKEQARIARMKEVLKHKEEKSVYNQTLDQWKEKVGGNVGQLSASSKESRCFV